MEEVMPLGMGPQGLVGNSSLSLGEGGGENHDP